MINKKLFYDTVRRDLFGGKLSQSQVLGMDTILNAYESEFSHIGYDCLAYVLATTIHETDKTMQPIEEYRSGRIKKDYGKLFKDEKGVYYGLKMGQGPGKRVRYYSPLFLYYGRGFVMITWYENYEKAGDVLGIDLLNNPSLALDLEIATKILFNGMIDGWFTTRKLSQFISKSKIDFFNARQIINGKDKALTIEGYAKKFRAALKEIEDI